MRDAPVLRVILGLVLVVGRAELNLLLHEVHGPLVVELLWSPIGWVGTHACEEEHERLRCRLQPIAGLHHGTVVAVAPRVVLGHLAAGGEHGPVAGLGVLVGRAAAVHTVVVLPLGHREVEGIPRQGVVLAVVLDVVAALLQYPEVVELVGLNQVSLRAVAQDVHVPARQHRHAGGRALCVHGMGLLKAHAGLREGVEVRRGLQGVPVGGEGLCAQRVREHEYKVHPLLTGGHGGRHQCSQQQQSRHAAA
mmetsp:Transcript_73382/g.215129  ORF Transcript_73382/g.215129 Transcript_73382/m.215129 type:complete len:250 (-) Transcript_73382:43-792(-)